MRTIVNAAAIDWTEHPRFREILALVKRPVP